MMQKLKKCPKCSATNKRGTRCKNVAACHDVHFDPFNPLCAQHFLKQNQICAKPLFSDQKDVKNKNEILKKLFEMNRIADAIVDRIVSSEKLIVKVCSGSILHQNIKNSLENFQKAESFLSKKLQTFAQHLVIHNTVSQVLFDEIVSFYNTDFENLERILHTDLEKHCKKQYPDTKMSLVMCNQETIPSYIQSWFEEIQDEWEDKHILCVVDQNAALPFLEKDMIFQGYTLVFKLKNIWAVAKPKIKKQEACSWINWKIVNAYTLSTIERILSSASWVVNITWEYVGYASEVLVSVYKNLSYKMLFIGLATGSGLMTMSYVTNLGLGPIMLFAKYARMFCQIVTTRASALILAALIAKGLVKEVVGSASYVCAFSREFAKVYFTIYGIRRYCAFLETIASIIFPTTVFPPISPDFSQQLEISGRILSKKMEETAKTIILEKEMTVAIDSFEVPPLAEIDPSLAVLKQTSIDDMVLNQTPKNIASCVPEFNENTFKEELSLIPNLVLQVQNPQIYRVITDQLQNISRQSSFYVPIVSFAYGVGMTAFHISQGNIPTAINNGVQLAANVVENTKVF